MKHIRAGLAIGTALTAALALSSCASNESTPASTSSAGSSAASLSGTISGIGSSAQGSAQDAWRQGFQQANSGVTVNYDPQGSGAGRTAFMAGGAQFAGSDSALKPEELSGTFRLCKAGTKAIDIPDYVSPIAIVFNVSGVKSLNLDASTIAKIFAGKVTKWNDPAITALNKGVSLPNANITSVHRSDKSGTTNNFTDYLNKAAPSVWTNPKDDVFPYKTGDGANGTSGVVSAVTNGKNTIGYADLSKAGSLSVAKIKIGSSFVAPSTAGAAKSVANSPIDTSREANDITVQINRTTTDASEYPLTLVSNLIVCQTYADAKVGSLVQAYAKYVTSDAGQQAAAKAAGSAALSGSLATKVAASVATVK
ncbi:MAG: phosphate transport system substrate-binding protein [Gaiellales bacterium]|nr:phosphate transport system substrate-binding protein [Gaiellales bacterium]